MNVSTNFYNIAENIMALLNGFDIRFIVMEICTRSNMTHLSREGAYKRYFTVAAYFNANVMTFFQVLEKHNVKYTGCLRKNATL